MSPVILEFKDLPEELEWADYHQLFSQFGTIRKLYIDRDGTFGKVYFDTIEEARAAYEDINGKPPFHLVLTEPILGDYASKNKNTFPAMNQVGYKYYDDVEGCITKFHHVDVFGRLVSTLEGEDGEIYVSLSELKKSGFELYQAGTLPRPGISKTFDEQLLYQFEMYLKMKATKFINTYKLNISQDSVNRIINKEINPGSGDRSVKMDATGLLKICASPSSNNYAEPAYSNRNRMSLDMNELPSYSRNRLNQKPRVSMSAIRPSNSHSGRANEHWNQRSNSFISEESNGRLSVRSDLHQRYGSDESLTRSYGKPNQRGGSYLSKDNDNRRNTDRNFKTNSINEDVEGFQRPMRRYNNDLREEVADYNHNKNSRNTYDDDNHSVGSYGHDTISSNAKPLTRASLNRNAPQKVTVVHVESDYIAWVHTTSNVDIIEEITTQTVIEAEKAKPIAPKVDLICAAEYTDIWFRAIVLSTDPLRVKYIDYGNESETVSELRGLSNRLCSMPSQAIRIKLVPGSYIELTNYIDLIVKVISQEQDGTYNVQVKELPHESQPKLVSNQKADTEVTIDSTVNLKETSEGISNTTTIKRRVSFAEETNKIDTDVAKETLESSAIQTKDDSSNIDTTVKRSVSFVETKDAIPIAKETAQSVTESTAVSSTKTLPPVAEPIIAESNTNCIKNEPKAELINTPVVDNSVKIPITPLRKCVVDVCAPDTGIFECIEVLGENTFIAFVFPNGFSTLLCELETITDETKPFPNFKPKIGDLVAVLKEGDYVRGTIINNVDGKYICACVDFGIVISTADTRPLPDKFINIPEFACFCKSDPEMFEHVSPGDSNMFTITTPGKLTLHIESAQKEFEIIASKWNPFETSSLAAVQSSVKAPAPSVIENRSVTPVAVEKPVIAAIYKLKPPVNKLNDKDIVIIVAEQQGCLLLRTKDCNTLLKQVNQELANYEGKPFEKPPEVGQLAVASFNEDGLYRVHVLSVKNNNATVEYIDYGNSDSVPFKMLLTVNEKLATMDNTLIKVNLKSFSGTKFSDKALKALEECSAKKEKYIAVHNGAENEYDLLSADQSSLSEKLMSLDRPVAPKLQLVERPPTPQPVVRPPAVPTKVIKMNDLPPSKFQIGLNNVICVYTGDLKEGNVSFCLNNKETSELLMEVQLKINEPVAKPTKPYKPENDEVCLAKYLDEWYRACVLEHDADGYSVSYIDFGNSHVVSCNDICKLPIELSKIEPLASVCILKGVLSQGTDMIQDSNLVKMQKDLQESEEYIINVKENVEGFLIITIPALYESWKKQGIL